MEEMLNYVCTELQASRQATNEALKALRRQRSFNRKMTVAMIAMAVCVALKVEIIKTPREKGV